MLALLLFYLTILLRSGIQHHGFHNAKHHASRIVATTTSWITSTVPQSSHELLQSQQELHPRAISNLTTTPSLDITTTFGNIATTFVPPDISCHAPLVMWQIRQNYTNFATYTCANGTLAPFKNLTTLTTAFLPAMTKQLIGEPPSSSTKTNQSNSSASPTTSSTFKFTRVYIPPTITDTGWVESDRLTFTLGQISTLASRSISASLRSKKSTVAVNVTASAQVMSLLAPSFTPKTRSCTTGISVA